jgi:anthranilate synthase component 2
MIAYPYNLAHLVKTLGAEVEVYRNDQFTLGAAELSTRSFSPGPWHPVRGGAVLLLDVIKTMPT